MEQLDEVHRFFIYQKIFYQKIISHQFLLRFIAYQAFIILGKNFKKKIKLFRFFIV
jgi:hypothetical protein